MENSKCKNTSPEFKKMWNNECLELFGDDSKDGRDLMYKDNKEPAWCVILGYIARFIKNYSRLSTERWWVYFLVNQTNILPVTLYAAFNKLKKFRMLFELEPNKWLIPNLRIAIILGIEDIPIVMKWLLPALITRRDQEQIWEREKQRVEYFIMWENHLKNKNKKKLKN